MSGCERDNLIGANFFGTISSEVIIVKPRVSTVKTQSSKFIFLFGGSMLAAHVYSSIQIRGVLICELSLAKELSRCHIRTTNVLY